MQINKAKKGFTLIELLIVIAIIGLLATLAIVSLTTAQRKARDTKRIADIKQLQNAVELYYSENATYPETAAASDADLTLPPDTVATWADFGTVISPYITNVPIDPTNTGSSVYVYGTNSDADEYFIGATLEDTTHDALDGDDDTAYTVAELPGLDTIESDGTNDLTATYSCVDAGGQGVYCTSE